MVDVDELVGRWDGAPYAYGAMESSELVFLPDGNGWARWMSIAGGLEITLFSWRRLDDTAITVTELRLVSQDGSMPLDETSVLRYRLVEEIPPLASEPTKALILDRAFMFATAFAFAQEHVTMADLPKVGTPDTR